MSARKLQYAMLFILTSIFVSCEGIFNNDDSKLTANAGPDQTTIVGSYVILDASKSNGSIEWYEWEQDEKNPQKVKIFSGYDYSRQQIGFVEKGSYKFRLIVKSGTKVSAADEALVTVNPNPQSLFEDPNLEIAVRFMLKLPTEILTDDILLTLDSLRYFDIVADISSLQGLQRCKNLTCLQMDHQSISDISPVATLAKLRVLDFAENQKISDITPLTNLIQLEWINLSDNLITDISPLANMIRLKYLNLRYNGSINDISSLSNMVQLEELKMANALLTNLSPLQKLSNLRTLWFTSCNISDISYLKNLNNLINLKITFGNINNLMPLSNLTKLEWLALEKNNTSDISALKNLPNLEYVRLWDNQVTNIKPLVDNAGVGKGDIVALNNNPLDEISVNEYIPALQARGVAVTW
ncbi:MAG: leucine-rich repeat domain-containing protein [Candidatus Zhuqueibacterota bacterium]